MHAYMAASSAHCLIVTLSGRSDSDDTLHRTAESLTHADASHPYSPMRTCDV